MSAARIRVLVVDDSAFVRKVVREMLSSAPHIEVVAVARDGEEALELVARHQPDVVTCDLLMPRLDGLGFVRRQMALRPLPILILTAVPQDATHAIDALEAGAVDLVLKPTALATDDLRAISQQLIEQVSAAAGAPVAKLLSARALAPGAASAIPFSSAPPHGPRVDALVIGVSTGGPQALRHLLPAFAADFPVPIAIVLHMPVGYTALFAEKLNEICPLEVREAKEGDVMRPGLVLLAAAGRHLVLRRAPDGSVKAQLTVFPVEKLHRPSVDVLFRSAAEVYGQRVLAVVMTGMGDDGKEGCGWVKAQGGVVLTESEKSCIIYGMPRSVDEAGLSDASAPLDTMARTIYERL
ncbi:chemotaxis response regulator protein-glutamate methylesterase [Horticoccus luteus]|uniref:Protein-glutamate methylesterase/protein-glutamine glutaminase n=1 Tax=Horticoccus luteus TaxID=2862869 RepID=A0A8F9TZ36_9BACT|nr:chemotaxis response regulator protein-glutamate methylesterase [Horticoccus luteus]QYM80646.1 chemotaxis response regulator protein-glutamate methylesterase [Horticoccus luteus]